MNESPTLSFAVMVFAMVGTMIELDPVPTEGPMTVVLNTAAHEAVPLPEALTPQEQVPTPMPAKQKEPAKADVALTPAEFPTAEEAAKRAADPRAPTGALILAPALKK